jgi:hypothetical protein
MQSEFTMPKVELHLHLEGAAPPALIQQMAHEKMVDIKGIFDQNGHYVFRDFTHFLAVYEAATSVLTQPLDFYRLTRAVLEQSAAHGVIYTEAFLSPDFCGQAELGPWREYLSAIQEAAADAEKSFGIVMKGIVTCIRHFGAEKGPFARQKPQGILSAALAWGVQRPLVSNQITSIVLIWPAKLAFASPHMRENGVGPKVSDRRSLT